MTAAAEKSEKMKKEERKRMRENDRARRRKGGEGECGRRRVKQMAFKSRVSGGDKKTAGRD
jgi:hypothetical protein